MTTRLVSSHILYKMKIYIICFQRASQNPELNTVSHYDRRVSDPYLFFARLQLAM